MKKKDFYLLHSEVCKTLANPKRQEILDNLRQKDMTVNELVKKTGISQANLSQHLALMRSKGILSTRREGNNVHYSLSNSKIIKAFDLISEVLRDSLSTQSQAVKSAIDRKK
ncbi:MAG: metalloregulator ArsR/SmtB family transcription factor [Candidatus Aminicenantes bacterium]|jgi:DNA-binding transcriptional ArsR family regulator|nr:metalloregulator ArsR/SmtB family transcription factor [Candidatus Aminicenantes bacterium]MDH5384130.1 metalloregulator ArsR/SmtB family transcription factor [Candidatus Aminicenantes bacterium]